MVSTPSAINASSTACDPVNCFASIFFVLTYRRSAQIKMILIFLVPHPSN
jgi:hypothetical protein